LLETVGLWEHRKHRLAQLSGGQQQRVAIAVALANKPRLLLGDEPTGEVDSATAQEILALFQRMNEQYGLTTIIVTHDPQVARVVDRVVTIRDGRTSSETVRRVNDTAPRSVQAVEAALAQSAQEVSASAVKPAEYEEYVVVDAAGRLQIPPDLREELGIGGRVTLEKTADGGISIYPVPSAQPTVSTQGQDVDSIDVREPTRPSGSIELTEGSSQAQSNDVQPASSQRTGLRRWLRRNKE
jgi:ABC-type glutathione transport system ATPase component